MPFFTAIDFSCFIDLSLSVTNTRSDFTERGKPLRFAVLVGRYLPGELNKVFLIRHQDTDRDADWTPADHSFLADKLPSICNQYLAINEK